MTVKNLLGVLNVTANQKVRICNESERRTYESEPGTFAFEGYEDGAEATWKKLSSLRVMACNFGNDIFYIDAE